jgi:hypothetical protein
MRFLAQLVRLPMAALAYGMDVFVKTMQESQRAATQPGEPPSAAKVNNSQAPIYQAPIYKEIKEMADQDLSADELKVVRYRIIFKKRDLEVTLHTGEDLVNYDTDGASFGALKIAEFLGRVALGEVPRPALWRDERYARTRPNNTTWSIPDEDRRYIGFLYEVIRREPRQEKEYDREQVRELRKIANRISPHRS